MARQRARADPDGVRGRVDRRRRDHRRRRRRLRAVRARARRERLAAAPRVALQRRPRPRRDRRDRCRTGRRERPRAHRRGDHPAVRRAQAALAPATRAGGLGAHPAHRRLVRLGRRAPCGRRVRRAQLGARERPLRARERSLRTRPVRGGGHRQESARPDPRSPAGDRRDHRCRRRAYGSPHRHPRRRRHGRPRLLRFRRGTRRARRSARQARRVGRRARLQRPPAARRPAVPGRPSLLGPVAAERLHGERRLGRALVPARARCGRSARRAGRGGRGDRSRGRGRCDAAVPAR